MRFGLDSSGGADWADILTKRSGVLGRLPGCGIQGGGFFGLAGVEIVRVIGDFLFSAGERGAEPGFWHLRSGAGAIPLGADFS